MSDTGRTAATWETDSVEFCRQVPFLLRLPAGADAGAPSPLVVGLHGMGMTPESFARWLAPLDDAPWALLLPQGPFPVELRHQGRMKIGHAWYAYRGDEDEWLAWMSLAETYLSDVLDAVLARPEIDADRVYLLGFSQGCYFGYYFGLKHWRRLAGLVAAGGRLKEQFIRPYLAAAAASLPVLILHGADDSSVPPVSAEGSRDVLRDAGFDVELVIDEAGHKLSPRQVETMRTWIARQLG